MTPVGTLPAVFLDIGTAKSSGFPAAPNPVRIGLWQPSQKSKRTRPTGGGSIAPIHIAPIRLRCRSRRSSSDQSPASRRRPSPGASGAASAGPRARRSPHRVGGTWWWAGSRFQPIGERLSIRAESYSPAHLARSGPRKSNACLRSMIDSGHRFACGVRSATIFVLIFSTRC